MEAQNTQRSEALPIGPTGGRGILQIHPSRRCNLRCLHCYSSSGPEGSVGLPAAALIRLIHHAADHDYSVVGISGGEPLLYPDLAAILSAAKHRGLTTTVTTNGVLLTEARLQALQGLVDVLAISLDGVPESHARMRNDPRAFAQMARRLPALAASGIPFGFVFTLTQANVHELAWVVDFAAEAGASLVQVHPLEAEGKALGPLSGHIPDGQELLFAVLEVMRLQSEGRVFLQLDVTSASDLRESPQRFLALPRVPEQPLGRWLTPLVLEPDGVLVPVTYGFPRPYAIGSILEADLPQLLQGWDPEPLLALARRTQQQALAGMEASDQLLTNWYAQIVANARQRAAA